MTGKPEITLVPTRLAGGVWEGVLAGPAGAVPTVEVSQGGRSVEGVTVQPLPDRPGQHAVRVPIPAWALNDGVQTFVVQVGGMTLAQFTLIAG